MSPIRGPLRLSRNSARSDPLWVAEGRSQASLESDFVEFAQAAGPRLCRSAYLMCRDWHLAQDLTQTTLAKMYLHWRRLSQTVNPEAYSRTVLMRTLIDQKRRRSGHEVPTAEFPSASGTPGSGPDLRLTLIDALAYLPARDRAIVVLRYWEDQSVDTVAETLGVSPAVVKKQSARSLTRLRDLLGDSRIDLMADEAT
jgi:RNA polymerase sigma-70 factor (sigma-E family)